MNETLYKDKTSSDTLMGIAIDADSIHTNIAEIILRFAKKYAIILTFVSDRELKSLQSLKDKYGVRAKFVKVEQGQDSADNWIVENLDKFFLVITHDIPLAARCLEKGVNTLSEHGILYDENSIKTALSSRSIMTAFRENGIYEKKGQKHPIGTKDIKNFSDALNSFLQKYYA